ncbi:MAG: hypothetical protein IJZ47_02345 [Oscillospiraceae bacterium]|nr:hypothetical protein [Oscillospiraceae bacterium]
MDHAIWLNRRKIFSADEISANFDIAAIRGYFLGGSLIRWLNANGGKDYARALTELSPSDPYLNDRLTEIFTGKKCNAPVHKADDNLVRAIELLRGGVPVTGSAQNVNGSFAYSFGSFSHGSFGYSFGSFRGGSFSYGSFAGGSFRRTWEWEWEWRFGSFRGGSFRYSGGSAAYNLSSYRGAFGSFGYNFGSYLSGSFMFGGSFRGYTLGSFPFDISYGMGSYRGFPLAGSFRAVTADEYDEIMYRCLSVCPLNRFGYGIHLI